MNIYEALKKSDIVKRPGVVKLDFGPGGSYNLCGDYLRATDWEPIIEPLTFERIRRECVNGRTFLTGTDGLYRLYLGFSRYGKLVTDTPIHKHLSSAWSEIEIKNWQISSEEWEG